MTLFDMIVLCAFALYGFAGFRKGGVREITGFIGVAIALVLAVYALPFSAPIVRSFVHPDWAGSAAALVLVFVLAYMVIHLAGEWIGKQIDEGVLGGFDRLIGLGFGVLRCLVFLGLFVLVFNAIVPKAMAPAWITGSIFYPLASGVAQAEAKLAPKGFAITSSVTKSIGDKVKSSLDGTAAEPSVQPADVGSGDRIVNNEGQAEQSPSTAPPRKGLHTPRHSPSGGYSPADRRAIDALVEQSR